MKAFPKIFALGADYIKDIFNERIEVTEKVDGSQFGFGKLNGSLYLRSKGKQIFPESPDKMFTEAVDYIVSIENLLPPGTMFYAEYLRKPKHNSLSYENIPKNHLALFGMMFSNGIFSHEYDQLHRWSVTLDIDIVPCLYYGYIKSPEEISRYLDHVSYLGGTKIEGVVIKNYERAFLLGGQPIPLMAGKLVSESFKEVHRNSWSKEHTNKGKWETFQESFKTEARWTKAIQHLRDDGTLLNDPKDIGALLKEVARDIIDEEKETIKDFLWDHFGKDLIRQAQRGFPEWYKQYLLKKSFE
jgi:hypothetical protein